MGCNGVDCEAAAAFAAAVAFFVERGAAFGAGRGAFGAGRAAAFFAERGAAFGGGSTDFFEMGALEEVAAADAGRWRLASASAALAALERERVDGCTMFRGNRRRRRHCFLSILTCTTFSTKVAGDITFTRRPLAAASTTATTTTTTTSDPAARVEEFSAALGQACVLLLTGSSIGL